MSLQTEREKESFIIVLHNLLNNLSGFSTAYFKRLSQHYVFMNEIEDVFAPYISIDDIGAKIESKSSENEKKV